MSNTSTVGAAGVPPVPNNTVNPQPNVVAGLDPPTDACITRPNMYGLRKLVDMLRVCAGASQTAENVLNAWAYIHHLEQQVTQLQSDQNLSLTTLRAERDQLQSERSSVVAGLDSPAMQTKYKPGDRVELFPDEIVTLKELYQPVWVLEETRGKRPQKNRMITEGSIIRKALAEECTETA